MEGITGEGEIKEDARAAVLADLRLHFRPEFLNRLDDVVLFKPLLLSEIEQIVGLLTDQLRDRLADRQLTLVLSPMAQRHIAEQGFDSVYGARPLRRYLQHELETKIGRSLLAGDIEDGQTITVDVVDDELHVGWASTTDPVTDDRQEVKA